MGSVGKCLEGAGYGAIGRPTLAPLAFQSRTTMGLPWQLWAMSIVLALMISTVQAGTFADLPNPPPNLMAVSAGSLVIPMDDTQTINGTFNFQSYGTNSPAQLSLPSTCLSPLSLCSG